MSVTLYDELGPKGMRRVRVATVFAIALTAAFAGFALLQLHEKGQLSVGTWGVFVEEPDILGLIAKGLASTLTAAATAMVMSILAGALMSAALLSQHSWLRLPVRTWMEVFRGLPVLLIIFFVYLGAPAFGFVLSAFWSLVIGLALYNSAVFAELFRAGVVSLPKGQREAGLAIGLTGGETLRIILLPQAARRMLPSLVSQAVIVLKETSLGFIIGYTELLREGRTAVEYLGGQYSLPIYTVLAVIYIALNLAISGLAVWLERRR